MVRTQYGQPLRATRPRVKKSAARSLVKKRKEPVSSAQPVHTDTVVPTVVLAVASSPSVSGNRDATSTSATFGTCSGCLTARVDFHGFSVLSQYVKHLEVIYQKEGEFWNSCIFKSEDFISCMLDGLGKALLIADVPWSSVSSEKLRLMLQLVDDAVKAGFRLDCIDLCMSKAKAFISIGVEKNKVEAQLTEVRVKITSLKKEVEQLENRQAELQQKLNSFSQFNSIDSSLWSYIAN